MKTTYLAPEASRISFETEAVLEFSFTGNSAVLGDSDNNQSSKDPATDFGGINLF